MREIIQNQAIEAGITNKYCTLVLPIRAGKSKVGIEIAKNYNKVLVSYPNETIFSSWKETSEKFGLSIENITFTTHLSINKFDLSEFDLVIIDELHSFSEANIEFFVENLPKRAIGLTGTPSDIGIKKSFIDNYLPIKYEIGIDITTGHTNKDYQITIHLLKPSEKKDILLKSGKYWSEKAKIDFWNNKYNRTFDFQDMLRLIQSIQNSKTKFDYLRKLSNKLDRGMIFLETSKQCDELGIPSYHSKNKDSEKNLEDFQEGKINLLSSIGQLRQGVTIKNCNKAIILHCYSSNNKSIQKLGRVLNLVEGEESKAFIDIIALSGTREEQWVANALKELEQNKIHYVNVS